MEEERRGGVGRAAVVVFSGDVTETLGAVGEDIFERARLARC